MNIYLETKSADAHRIVFTGNSNKLVYSGEWVRRKGTAYDTLWSLAFDLGYPESIRELKKMVIERKYKANSFAKNSGPKKRK